MKLLREYIRELLKEEGELGSQVFANKAPKDSRHFGNEPDTQLEQELFDAIYRHLNVGGTSASTPLSSLVPLLRQLIQDPNYNDVFTEYTGRTACRGTSQTLTWARKHIPDFDNMPLLKGNERLHGFQKYEAWTKRVSVPPFVWQSRTGLDVSSWSTNQDVCERYLGKSEIWEEEGGIGVILFADTTQSDFLDVRELYKYRKLNKFQKEAEVVGLGPIIVNAVIVYKEIPEEVHANLTVAL